MRPGTFALGCAVAAAALTTTPSGVAAQLADRPFGPPPPVPAVDGGPGVAGGPGGAALLRTPGGAFAASLALPGAGQAALGLRRWPAYLALEAGFWWLWADARGDFRGFRDGYRDLAWEVARIREGPRRDGGWSYYETMSRYVASGAFDIDPAPGLQPEEDPTTWNGTVWEIARGVYLPGGVSDPEAPEYALALDWYRQRAAGPGFLWSWSGRASDLDRFRALIGSADDARRTQTTALGLILANHLVSAVDALIAARIMTPGRPELHGRLLPGPVGPIWRLELRVPLTN